MKKEEIELNLQKAERYIAEGETKDALYCLMKFTPYVSSEMKRYIILTSSQFNRFIRDNVINERYTLNDIESRFNLINTSILDCIEQIQEEQIKYQLENENSNLLIIEVEVPDLLRTPLQQYFLFFSDFVKSSKGVSLKFEISKNEIGLEISLSNNNNIPLDIIQIWLNEYMSFAKGDIENIEIIVENEKLNQKDRENLVLELKNQIIHLKNSIDLLKKKGKSLIKENKYLQGIVSSNQLINLDSSAKISPFNHAENLISNGNIVKALEILISIIDKEDDMHTELKLQFSRISTLNLDSRLGIIDESVRYKELNKINKSVLECIELLKKRK